MDNIRPHFLFDFLLVILFTYGIFYTSYKFARPDLGNQDFAKYEKMVDSPMNMQATRAPFVLRQLPTLVATVTKECGIYYPNKISFAESVYNKSEASQRNFFALILSNYLAVVVGLTIMIRYLRKQTGINTNVHFTVLALCLGYFMLSLNIIAPLTQGYGWLATIVLIIGLLNKKYVLVLTGLLIALFSRETVVLFFMVFAIGLAIYNYRRKVSFSFARNAAIVSFLSLLLLLSLRIAFTSGNANQLSITHILSETGRAMFTADYLFQAILTQGLLIYVFSRLYVLARPIAIMYGLALLVIMLVGGFGVGRIIGESYPLLVIFYCLPTLKTREFLNL
jgi:hypothetical protein